MVQITGALILALTSLQFATLPSALQVNQPAIASQRQEPKTAKTMEILEFIKATEVDPVYFDSSYYMLPEEAGRRPYALLTQALEHSAYVAIAKLTMHNREYTVFLRASQWRPHASHDVLC